MPSYQKMYRIMLKAASEAAESLDIYERLVADQTRKLREALREAEELCFLCRGVALSVGGSLRGVPPGPAPNAPKRPCGALFSALWPPRAHRQRPCLPRSTPGTVPETHGQGHCARGAAAGGLL